MNVFRSLGQHSSAERQWIAALILLVGIGAPAMHLSAQTPNTNPWEDSLLATRWDVRNDALFNVREFPESISVKGRNNLVELLGREIDGTIPRPTPDMIEDEESYGGYLADLTNLVARFNDPRATPYFIRGGIAYSMGARFQVAVAGDAAVDGLVATWAGALPIRPAVISTFGYMLQYADSTGRTLTPAHRAAVRIYLLMAATDSAPWVRAAFVDAAVALGDPSYVGVVQWLAAHDSATIDGDRYVARAANSAAAMLSARLPSKSTADLTQALTEQITALCGAGWDGPNGQCQSLVAKTQAAQAALGRSQPDVAAQALHALQNEADAQRGKHLTEIAYALLSGNINYLLSRL